MRDGTLGRTPVDTNRNADGLDAATRARVNEQGLGLDVGAGGNTAVDANQTAVAGQARVRDPNYRWHNDHWWYRTPRGWVFWYDNQWRPYDRGTYYTYYPRGWNNGYANRGPNRSYYRAPGTAYRYNYDPGYRYGYRYGSPYGWGNRNYYNRGWYNDGLRFGGRGFRRW